MYARNYGIAVAIVEWITFVDGDDFMYSGMYQDWLDMLYSAQRTDVVISCCKLFSQGSIC